jgi:excisionase family DNA binding protein
MACQSKKFEFFRVSGRAEPGLPTIVRSFGSREVIPATSHIMEHRMSTAAFGDVRFLTVAEVAAVMRVSKMTVYRLVHSGELPAVRVGRSFRVPEQAVQDYLRDSIIETA